MKCLCSPEDFGSVKYPGDLHGYLSDKQMVFDLEHKYRVIVEFKDGKRVEDPGEAIVQGTNAVNAVEADFIGQDAIIFSIITFSSICDTSCC